MAYAHGHHESVLRSHAARTVADSAAYLVSSLSAGARILDVGAGPGTITVDLADRVFPGEVAGVDAASDVIEIARAAAGERTRISDAWREWAEHPDGWILLPHGEVLARG